jgi:hypothetical protein
MPATTEVSSLRKPLPGKVVGAGTCPNDGAMTVMLPLPARLPGVLLVPALPLGVLLDPALLPLELTPATALGLTAIGVAIGAFLVVLLLTIFGPF